MFKYIILIENAYNKSSYITLQKNSSILKNQVFNENLYMYNE